MDHGEATERDDQVGEPRPGSHHPQRRQPDTSSSGSSPGELDDPGHAELGRGRRQPARSDAQHLDEPLDAEVVPPPNQPAFPGFEGSAFSFSYTRSAPMPPASELAEYERFMPGLAREIVNEAFANMASDRKINELAVETSAKLDIRGLWIAGALCATCILCALLCLFFVQPPLLAGTGAGIFGLGAIAPAINAFLNRGSAKEEPSTPPSKPAPPSPDEN